jgi:hypothetical protein
LIKRNVEVVWRTFIGLIALSLFLLQNFYIFLVVHLEHSVQLWTFILYHLLLAFLLLKVLLAFIVLLLVLLERVIDDDWRHHAAADLGPFLPVKNLLPSCTPNKVIDLSSLDIL